MPSITLEQLNASNRAALLAIKRDDISEDVVDSTETILELTQYGVDHGCIGHTYAIRYGTQYAGIILMGEGIPWPCDPPELAGIPFYRIMGFVVDQRYRNLGIGSQALEMTIQAIYEEYGPRPIALAVQESNLRAMRFYEAHGFVRNAAMDEDDCYFLRYPR
ncbi:MAG: GNAT family N-acetyltransferase [Clostridia bacterium]|nr:GNAT family N-acetyltransferase [Clostridia bacterium]